MRDLKIKIVRKNGRWLANDKRLNELSQAEKEFMDNFFKVMKLAETEDEEVKHFINRKASDQNASIKYAELLK